MSGHVQEPSRRGYAIGLMISSSVAISFTGLIVRHLDVDPMVMNFYRALSLMVAIVLIVAVKYRRMAILSVIRVGWPGVLGAVMLTIAAISFLKQKNGVSHLIAIVKAHIIFYFSIPKLIKKHNKLKQTRELSGKKNYSIIIKNKILGIKRYSDL